MALGTWLVGATWCWLFASFSWVFVSFSYCRFVSGELQRRLALHWSLLLEVASGLMIGQLNHANTVLVGAHSHDHSLLPVSF